jgi:hypothetical protein
MALVVPDQGEVRLLQYIVNKNSPTNLVLHLYTNDVALLTDEFSTGSFTEATATGYSSVTLTGAGWTASTTAGISAALYGTGITFSFSVGQNVQGYYVTDTSNNILWAEEFPGAPFQLPNAGGDIAIRPQIQLS